MKKIRNIMVKFASGQYSDWTYAIYAGIMMIIMIIVSDYINN